MTSEGSTPRYCALCGEAFEAPVVVCPNCGETWAEPLLRRDLPTTAAVLSTLQRWIAQGLITPEAAAPLRVRYERRLEQLHGRPRPAAPAPEETPEPAPPAAGTPTPTPAMATAGAPAAAAAAVGPPAAGARPRGARARASEAARRPPQQPPFDVLAWVARRQADILLYLGAFLLVVSALIFVSRQEGELETGWRVGLLAAYTIGFIATGLLIGRWPRVQEAGPVFLAIGALFTPLNFVLLYTEVLQDRGVDASAIWFGGAAYSTLFYGVLFRQGFGRLYALPAAVGLHVAWGALFFVLNLPGEWFWPWWLAFAVAATVAFWELGVRRPVAMLHPALIGGLAFLMSHSVLSIADELQNGPLPASYALLTVGVTYYLYVRREFVTPAAAATGVAATGVAALWAFGFEPDWYAYPPLAVAALIAVTQPRWSRLDTRLGRVAWLLVVLAASVPVLTSGAYLQGAHGVVAHAAAALLLATVAWRNLEEGLFAEFWSQRQPTLPAERVVTGWAAFIMALVTIGYAQREFGVDRPDLGWAYLAVGALVAFLTAREGRRDVRAFAVLLPPFALTTAVSLQAWDRHPGHDAIYLGVPAVEMLLVFAWTRRWAITLGAAGLAVASAAAAWDALDWEVWTLALAYGGAGLALFAGLARRRDYFATGMERLEESYSTILLTWGMLATAVVTAAIALEDRATPGIDAPSTIEYRVFIGIIAAVGLLLSIEGWRLKRWDVQVPALAIVAGSVGAAWPAVDFEPWTLGPVYLLATAVLLVVLTQRRAYEEAYESAAIVVLSWGLAPAAIAAAAIALGLRAEPGYDPPSTIEYRSLVAIIAAVGAFIALEGRRLRRWDIQVPALATGIGTLGAAWPAFGFATWTLGPVYAAIGVAFLVALAARRRYEALEYHASVMIVLSWALPIAAVVASAVALANRAEPGFDAPSTIEYRSLVAVIGAAGLMLAAEGWRVGDWQWEVPALALVAGAVAAAWPAAEFEPWTLGPFYGVAGAVLFVALGSRREYGERDGRAVSLQILSWSLLGTAVVVAWYLLGERINEGARPEVKLVEYRALIATIVVFAPLLAYEARRIPQRSLYIVAGAVVVAALEMVIATYEPTNVQAYTVPAALYAGAVSLVIRRSPMLLAPHVQWHEAVTIIGATLLVLPQAEQGFEPGGQGWALVLLFEGAVFLALSFALTARWLAVAGVMTMSGVALRALSVNRDAVPYWIMLGAAGLLLLAAGFTLLLQRELWDRARRGLTDWWSQRALLATEPTDIHLLALLAALAPAITAASLPLGD